MATGLNILVADDETATTTTLSYVLKKAGHSVDVVRDGSEALSKLRQRPEAYQLLITDHAMKDVSGLELVKQLQKSEYRGAIVVLSAFITRDVKDMYARLGVKRFIYKPFDLSELRENVNQIAVEPGRSSPRT